jgi:uncharacterized membrane protein
MIGMEQKNWEARFEHSGPRHHSPLTLLSWTALAVASIYGALVTWILVGVSRDVDPESVTAGWIVFGFPWVLVLGRHYWFAIPLNALTLYLAVLAVIQSRRHR